MNVPFVSDDQIFHIAENFLKNYNPSNILPVPIESIAEQQLNLMILPIQDLEVQCEVAGSISKDFNAILIDEKTYINQEKRARFTIAHEVGHCVLHKEIFSKANGSYSKREFVVFQNSLDGTNHKRLEIQAFRFAEEVLCPRQMFSDVVQETIEELGGTGSMIITDVEKILNRVSQEFLISSKAALNKLRRDFPGIIESIQSNNPF